MLLPTIALSIAMGTVSVPPGALAKDHSQPYHWTQPTVRVFVRQAEDDERKHAYHAYCHELEQYWRAYRSAGSTPAAWDAYQASARRAKRLYIYNDAYLKPITESDRRRLRYQMGAYRGQ